jgi:hypothetical protein
LLSIYKKNRSLTGFFMRAIPWRNPASGQSHWRSAVHCQTVGNAVSGFTLSGQLKLLKIVPDDFLFAAVHGAHPFGPAKAVKNRS